MNILVFFTFVYFVTLSVVSAETYYIVATENTSCSTLTTPIHNASFPTTPTNHTPLDENHTCLTLTQFAQLWSLQRVHSLSDINITLNFVPGNHTLHSRLQIQNVTNLVLQVLQVNVSSPLVAMVMCTNYSGFIFKEVSEVGVNGLVFNGCRENSVRLVDQLRVEDCVFQNGHGMELWNVMNATFERSTFISLTAFVEQGVVGGAIATFGSNLLFVGCLFELNSANGSGGAVWTDRGSTTSVQSCRFVGNNAAIGGAIAVDGGNIIIHDSTFNNNMVRSFGGAIAIAYYDLNSYSYYSNDIIGCNFSNNLAAGSIATMGGAIYAESNLGLTIKRSILIQDCFFTNNTAAFTTGLGGALHVAGNLVVVVRESNFSKNTAYTEGGAIWVNSNSINMYIYDSHFNKNTALKDGGAIWLDLDIKIGGTSISIHGSEFTNNTAGRDGGALYLQVNIFASRRVNNIGNSIFNHNHAANQGGAIFIQSATVIFQGFVQITNSSAMTGVVFALQSTLFLSGNTTISDNKASFYAFACNVTFTGHTIFTNNVHMHESSVEEGGAITSLQSEIVLVGTVKFAYNSIQQGNGGAILSSESTIFIGVETMIANNTALSGGGIYAFQSEFTSDSPINILGNTATLRGGGIYFVGSSIRLIYNGQLLLTGNRAERGGGVYLELNAKLYIIKAVYYCAERLPLSTECIYIPESMSQMFSPQLYLVNNSADYGGAIYVSDDTNSGTCASNTDQPTSSECFFQDLALHSFNHHSLIVRDVFFVGNTANTSGGTIFGGLLDRCTVSPFAEVFNKYQTENTTTVTMNAVSYLTNTTSLQAHDIKSELSSNPVRVCFCENNQPDCDRPPPTYSVKKGETFIVSLVAVDQIGNPLPSSVRAFLSSNLGGLGDGQNTQDTTSECTELNFTITSPLDSEQLVLYADGPCNDLGISQTLVNVTFLPCDCPIGFVPSDHQSSCSCECDPCLYPNYTSDCSVSKSSVQRRDNIWISYINISDLELIEGYPIQCPYLIYPHCPFDYCHPSTSANPVFINLNTPNGSDAQCAFKRSGKLCGSCKDGLSLTLGSSRCMPCSNNWLALLIVFAIAGVALVAFLLVFNLTVAVGTINGLLFYANILAINHATFFPFDTPSSRFFTVFIAWLNLDFGFVTCFFDGMDGYAKQWLQLAFPVYIILIVTMVIIGCEYSTRIAKFFTGTNPVATLATLILLSYTKSVRLVIAALSYATLEYPDGSREKVWLIDANVLYFGGKHVPLFLVALLILVVGTVYTSLLFSYQWLLHCPNRRSLKWIKNARFYPFMDAYLAPYNLKHRYWTGLLLLIRAFLYVIAAFNISGDPGNNLISIILTLTCLHLLKILLPGRVYKSWPLDALESSFIFNLIMFSAGSLYIRATSNENQEALAYTSTSIAFVTFLGILVYHTHTYVLSKKHGIKQRKSLFSKTVAETRPDLEIILIPKPQCTHSVIDGPGVEYPENDTTTQPDTSNPSDVPSNVNMTGQSSTDKSRVDNDIDGQQKRFFNNTDIELFRSSAFTDCQQRRSMARDSDELGIERETEVNNIFN